MPAAIPALGWMVVLFASFAGYIVARGMLATWTHSVGWLLQWLAVHARIPIRLPHVRDVVIDLGRPFRAADAAVLTALQTWATGAEIEMGYALHGLTQIWDWTVQAVEEMARESERFDTWLVHQFVPKHVQRRVGPVAREAKRADNRARDAQASTANLAHVKPHIDRRSGAKVTPKPNHFAERLAHDEAAQHATAAKVALLAGAIAVPHPWRIPRVSDTWRGLTRKTARIERRLARLEKIIAATTAGALVARVLGVSPRCLGKGGNLARAARGVCRAPAWLIRFLVAGAIEAFVVSDLCNFSLALQQAAKAIRPALMAFVDVEDALIGCGDNEKPLALTLPDVSLPAVFGSSPLAG